MFGGGAQKLGWGDAYAAETRRIRNILLQIRIVCYASFVWILPSNLEMKTKKKKKKGLHRKILGYLITFT